MENVQVDNAMTDADPYNLERFVDAQDDAYERALAEIARGRKTTHWMWFIFPQIEGLGSSAMAERYAIGSLAEARAYLEHPLLGARYRRCVSALQDLVGTTAEKIFGDIDARKLFSSLTLFAEAAPSDRLFAAALDRWLSGRRDPRTLARLDADAGHPG